MMLFLLTRSRGTVLGRYGSSLFKQAFVEDVVVEAQDVSEFVEDGDGFTIWVKWGRLCSEMPNQPFGVDLWRVGIRAQSTLLTMVHSRGGRWRGARAADVTRFDSTIARCAGSTWWWWAGCEKGCTTESAWWRSDRNRSSSGSQGLGSEHGNESDWLSDVDESSNHNSFVPLRHGRGQGRRADIGSNQRGLRAVVEGRNQRAHLVGEHRPEWRRWEASFKLELLEFYGGIEVEKFLDWLNALNAA
ncbi:hypothetical protein Adt_27376 [Abeliophyllum distichum]|uniref:Uncharacterized protein n=1 Tax=Abeliophyllum distichum TaxID=126358 RepID=A0ABD1RTJ8_9LAMI